MLAFCFGAVWGSFANVVIHRLPLGQSVVKPPSACPNCGHQIRWWENVPILSFVFLMGRCSSCRTRISPRYLLVEAVCGGLWLATTLWAGLRPHLVVYLVFATVLLILSVIDLEHRKIPNKVLWPAAVASVPLLVLAALLESEPERILWAAMGAAAYGLPMLALGLLVPKGMGGGDIKLAGYLGLHLGWIGLHRVPVGAFLGFSIGSILGVGLMLAGRKGRKDTIPFGPSMAAGALISMIWGGRLFDLWLP